MVNQVNISKEFLLGILETVTDPEIPVLTIKDLGILRDVQIKDDGTVEVFITPTYNGCPAMDMIATNIRLTLAENGIQNIKITSLLSPAWTTDWMSEEGCKPIQDREIVRILGILMGFKVSIRK